MEKMLIPDDHIISCIERTGYPPWNKGYDPGYDDDEDEDFWVEGDDGDVYYGNETSGF